MEEAAHAAIRRVDAQGTPESMRVNWKTPPASADEVWLARVQRDRSEIVPWLATLAPLSGARVLEIGSGRGASTFALTEQGARVTAVDVNRHATDYATAQLSAVGLRATFQNVNAADLDHFDGGPFDLVIFWASLEHMTVHERARAIRGAWALLQPGGSMAIVETPNRLWPYDSHTSRLPFFNWLPDEVAFPFLATSSRDDIRTDFSDYDAELLTFQRLGRGVSYHEFELALGADITPSSCLQLERRRANVIRRLAWFLSSAGRTERVLRGYAPEKHRAWFQPFLYLALTRAPTTSPHG